MFRNLSKLTENAGYRCWPAIRRSSKMWHRPFVVRRFRDKSLKIRQGKHNQQPAWPLRNDRYGISGTGKILDARPARRHADFNVFWGRADLQE
jgi:hypothetical protein